MIPSLVLVETWQWTPLVMLIVLGGLAAMPRDPFESAEIDGANGWQKFRYITLPMILPFMMVAVIIRSIDALKSFDIIFAMTQGGPGTASETINIYLYNVAFAYYDIGYGSALAVVFFIVIITMSLALLYLRQRTKWNQLRRSVMRFAICLNGRDSLRRLRDRFTGNLLLPVDAVAVAEIRNRQRRLSADLYSGKFRLVELYAISSPPMISSHYFWNSLLVTGTATLLALLVGVPAGYGIARLQRTSRRSSS